MDGGAAKKGYVPSVVARGVALLACAALMTIGCSRGETGLMLGYDDFVCLDGTAYEAIQLQAGGDTAGRVDPSSAYARTEVQMQGSDAPRPGGRFRDGDAGRRERGTPVSPLEAHAPGSPLPPRLDGRWHVYDAKIPGESGAVPCSRG